MKSADRSAHSKKVHEQTPKWPVPLEQPVLGPKDVHVWLASLGQPSAVNTYLRKLLSRDEQAKADRYHFERDRQHFTVARGRLRELLSRYLGTDPAELRFAYSEYGKPRLEPEPSSFNFNLAHSGGFALYAFTAIGEIGVDLEFIRPEFTGDEIARRFFSPSEVACLSKLADEMRARAFFDCWARKEAVIKAKGLGLSLGLDQFDVALTPGQPAALLRTRWDETEASRWSLRAVDVGPDFAAALALEADDWQVSYWQVPEDEIAP
jgi:4'-phosphopantetheinyl transferase